MECSKKAISWKRNDKEGLSAVSEGTERGALHLSDSEVSVVGTQKTKKEERRWF